MAATTTNVVTEKFSGIVTNVVTSTPVNGLEKADDFLQSLAKLSPQASLVLALVLLGKVLKMAPHLDNRWIPAIIFPAGAFGWCAISGWSWTTFIQGHIYGGCAVGIHQFWKLSLGETVGVIFTKLGGVLTSLGNQAGGTGNTTIQTKPPETKPPETKPPAKPDGA